MADNVQLNLGSGGDILAAHDLGSSIKIQKSMTVDSLNNPTANRISTTSFNSRDAATLAAGATFQGVGEDVSMYGRAGIAITSDNATDGVLTIEVSHDDSTWGGPTRNWADTRFGQPHMWVIVEKYFRIKYVNGTTEATNLAIQVHYASDANILLGHQLDETLIPETEAIVVRSVIVGLDSDETYVNIHANKGNALLTGDFGSEVALGNIDGYQIDTKFGRNSDIDAGPEDIWEGGGTYPGQPVGSAETVTVVSASTADTSAGTGARTVRVFGLKTSSSTAYESEDVTMNGTTLVDTVATWWRVNRVYVLTAGTGGGNAGIISVAHKTTTANIFGKIPVGTNQTMVGAYTVPSGMTMLIKRIRAAITRSNGSAGSAQVTLRMRTSGGVYRAIRNFELQTGASVEFTAIGGIVCPSGCDLKWTVESVSDTNTVADGAFEYLLFEN